MKAMKVILIALLSAVSINSLENICVNQEGKQVDWYVMFLLPQSSSKNILTYGYFDYNSTKITYHNYTIDTFPPTLITKQILSNKTDFNWFLWNDDKTCKDDTEGQSASSSKAHAKGGLVFNKDSGAFLQHSLPRFPTRMLDDTILLENPQNTGQYGQSFLCISVDTATVYKIAELLNYINVSNNLSVKTDRVNAPSFNPWINKLIINKMDNKYPKKAENTINSLNKTEFTFFSKGGRLDEIPFDNTLRQAYNDTFYVRTWTRPELAPSLCDKNQILNVMTLIFDGKYEMTENKEHSKWAVSKKKNICCFGDMNHCPSQKKRGGHIICFENKALAQIMRDFIEESDSCENNLLHFLS